MKAFTFAEWLEYVTRRGRNATDDPISKRVDRVNQSTPATSIVDQIVKKQLR